MVQRQNGERSFHIFYQMLTGFSSEELNKFRLVKDPKAYKYLAHSECFEVKGMKDDAEFKLVLKSMKVLGFTEQAKEATWKLLSAILHLGNVEFIRSDAPAQKNMKQAYNEDAPIPHDTVSIKNPEETEIIAELLGVHKAEVNAALTFRTLSTGASRRASLIKVPLDYDSAVRARDALAKALYSGLFDYVVEQVNVGIKVKGNLSDKLTIGILDIYGL